MHGIFVTVCTVCFAAFHDRDIVKSLSKLLPREQPFLAAGTLQKYSDSFNPFRALMAQTKIELLECRLSVVSRDLSAWRLWNVCVHTDRYLQYTMKIGAFDLKLGNLRSLHSQFNLCCTQAAIWYSQVFAKTTLVSLEELGLILGSFLKVKSSIIISKAIQGHDMLSFIHAENCNKNYVLDLQMTISKLLRQKYLHYSPNIGIFGEYLKSGIRKRK